MSVKVERRDGESIDELLSRFRKVSEPRVERFLEKQRFEKPSKKRRKEKKERQKKRKEEQRRQRNQFDVG